MIIYWSEILLLQLSGLSSSKSEMSQNSTMCEVTVLFDGYSKLVDDVMEANCSCTLIKGPKTIIVDTMTAWDKERLVEGNKRNSKLID